VPYIITDFLFPLTTASQLKITNTVPFALQYAVVVQNIGRGNANGTQPFDAIPADAVVAQSSFKDIQVR
jgi:uncharacterized repeat protein (TIGR01451 family)